MIDITPITDLLIQTLLVLLAAFGSFALNELKNFLKIKKDSALSNRLDGCLHRGLDLAERRLSAMAEAYGKVHTSNQVLELAGAYVVQQMPDTLKHFGITPERLAQMLEARLHDRSINSWSVVNPD
jgi:hypothetical protein